MRARPGAPYCACSPAAGGGCLKSSTGWVRIPPGAPKSMQIHHIIPKHEWKIRFGSLDGFNGKDNKILLTVGQHAEAHRWLWEHNGSVLDKIAYLALSGQITNEEAIRRASSAANKGVAKAPEHRRVLRERQTGKKHSLETRRKMSDSHKVGICQSESYKEHQKKKTYDRWHNHEDCEE